MKLLVESGMQKIRMGIQSGSRKVLSFYRRPYSKDKIISAARIINRYSKYIIPPYYDIILDNPIETRDDIRENLEFFIPTSQTITTNQLCFTDNSWD